MASNGIIVPREQSVDARSRRLVRTRIERITGDQRTLGERNGTNAERCQIFVSSYAARLTVPDCRSKACNADGVNASYSYESEERGTIASSSATAIGIVTAGHRAYAFAAPPKCIYGPYGILLR